MTTTTTSHLNAGHPFDNDSVARRLAELPFTAEARELTVSTSGGEFAGFQARPAHPDPQLGDAAAAPRLARIRLLLGADGCDAPGAGNEHVRL